MTVTSGTGISLSAATVHEAAGRIGALLAEAAIARGLAGLVINGGVRDSRRLIERGRPVFVGYIQRLRAGETTLAIYQLPWDVHSTVPLLYSDT
jgi:regulator of RNase E activity RraA